MQINAFTENVFYAQGDWKLQLDRKMTDSRI